MTYYIVMRVNKICYMQKNEWMAETKYWAKQNKTKQNRTQNGQYEPTVRNWKHGHFCEEVVSFGDHSGGWQCFIFHIYFWGGLFWDSGHSGECECVHLMNMHQAI